MQACSVIMYMYFLFELIQTRPSRFADNDAYIKKEICDIRNRILFR